MPKGSDIFLDRRRKDAELSSGETSFGTGAGIPELSFAVRVVTVVLSSDWGYGVCDSDGRCTNAGTASIRVCMSAMLSMMCSCAGTIAVPRSKSLGIVDLWDRKASVDEECEQREKAQCQE